MLHTFWAFYIIKIVLCNKFNLTWYNFIHRTAILLTTAFSKCKSSFDFSQTHQVGNKGINANFPRAEMCH